MRRSRAFVTRGVARTDATMILIKSYVESPMDLVFDSPMGANDIAQILSEGTAETIDKSGLRG